MQFIKNDFTVEDTIKKSRFIGILSPCNTELDVARILKNLQLKYPDASHIAYAYRIKTDNGFISRFYDAGEPSGTAGKPIFHHLEGKELINVLLAVVRYFGGIKLGAGGLTRAYGNTAKKVIDSSELLPYVERVIRRLTLDYNQMQPFEYVLKKLDGNILSQDFSVQIQVLLELPKSNLNALSEAYKGLDQDITS